MLGLVGVELLLWDKLLLRVNLGWRHRDLISLDRRQRLRQHLAGGRLDLNRRRLLGLLESWLEVFMLDCQTIFVGDEGHQLLFGGAIEELEFFGGDRNWPLGRRLQFPNERAGEQEVEGVRGERVVEDGRGEVVEQRLAVWQLEGGF